MVNIRKMVGEQNPADVLTKAEERRWKPLEGTARRPTERHRELWTSQM